MVERDSGPTLDGGRLAAAVSCLSHREASIPPRHPVLVIAVDAEAGPNHFQQTSNGFKESSRTCGRIIMSRLYEFAVRRQNAAGRPENTANALTKQSTAIRAQLELLVF